MRCSIGTLPPEIISDILIDITKGFGDDIRLKWRFPLLIRRVSKQFYGIATNTRSLWRYLYISDPPHPYLHAHILNSGILSLEVYVMCQEPSKRDIQPFTEITNFIIPLCPRLATLSYYSPFDSKHVAKILENAMPVLESLQVEGEEEYWTEVGFPGSRFPRLRSLRSLSLFSLRTDMKLPESLEELEIQGGRKDSAPPSQKLWSLLSTNLRLLRIEPIMWSDLSPHTPITRLACLTELTFKEYLVGGGLSILHFLDAPALQTLVGTCYEEHSEPHNPTLALDFPALIHLEWTSSPNLRWLNSIIRGRNALQSISITLHTASVMPDPSISDFITALAVDSALLPSLEDLAVHGASSPSLIRLFQARPHLKSVKVHGTELGLNSGERWVERRGWLESQSATQEPEVNILAE